MGCEHDHEKSGPGGGVAISSAGSVRRYEIEGEIYQQLTFSGDLFY